MRYAFEARRLMVLVVDPGVIDFGEIVVLGGEPEDGNSVDAFGRETLGKAHGGERFVNGVGRTGEKTNLLSSDYGDCSGAAQAVEQRTVAVLFAQCGD